jgi:hypothetical protein
MTEFTFKRSIPMEDGYDLVVAGAGPAGTVAAISAARLGAKVLLVDPMNCLGGMGTAGMVAAFGPMSDGVNRLVQGVMGEIVDAMYERGYLVPGANPDMWQKTYMIWTNYNPEGLKIIYDEFVQKAGVEVRLLTSVIGAELDPDDNRRVQGVILSNIDGLSYVKAKAFIDGTGDAILADFCGVEYREAYRDTPHGLPATVAALYAGCDWEVGLQHVDEHQALIEKAQAEGRFTVIDRHFTTRGAAIGITRIGGSTGYLNAGHLFKVNVVNNKSMTEALMWGRKQLLEYLDFIRKDLPGFAKAEMIATASLLGKRESRRIVGEAEITKEDFFAKRHFPDQIGVYNRFMDIHPYDDSLEEWQRFLSYKEKNQLGVGNHLGIPYGILVPKGWKNLWIAGRTISCDTQVLGTLRAQPCCALMGQAAGTAAVQSIRTGQPAHALDTDALRTTLREQGAYIPE